MSTTTVMRHFKVAEFPATGEANAYYLKEIDATRARLRITSADGTLKRIVGEEDYTLDELLDVVITNAQAGQQLVYDGAVWRNQFPTFGDITVEDLTAQSVAAGAANLSGNLTFTNWHTGIVSPNGGSLKFQGGTGDLVVDVATAAFRVGVKQLYVHGDTGRTGFNTSTPRRRVDALDASDPQYRITHTDNSIYTDLFMTASELRFQSPQYRYFFDCGGLPNKGVFLDQPNGNGQDWLTFSLSNDMYRAGAFGSAGYALVMKAGYNIQLAPGSIGGDAHARGAVTVGYLDYRYAQPYRLGVRPGADDQVGVNIIGFSATQAAPLQTWSQYNSNPQGGLEYTVLSQINADGSLKLVSLTDANAPANSWYFSTTQNKPACKRADGTVFVMTAA